MMFDLILFYFMRRIISSIGMILGGYPCVCAKRCLGFCRWQEWQDVSILVTKIERKSRERHRVKRLLLPLTPHSARNITITTIADCVGRAEQPRQGRCGLYFCLLVVAPA